MATRQWSGGKTYDATLASKNTHPGTTKTYEFTREGSQRLTTEMCWWKGNKNVSTLFVLAKRRRCRRAIISASECFEINVELFVPFNAIIIPFCFCQKHKWHKEEKKAKSSPSLVHGVELRLMLHVSHVARLSALVKWWKQKFSQTNAWQCGESKKKASCLCVACSQFSIKSITNHNNGAWASGMPK